MQALALSFALSFVPGSVHCSSALCLFKSKMAISQYLSNSLMISKICPAHTSLLHDVTDTWRHWYWAPHLVIHDVTDTGPAAVWRHIRSQKIGVVRGQNVIAETARQLASRMCGHAHCWCVGIEKQEPETLVLSLEALACGLEWAANSVRYSLVLFFYKSTVTPTIRVACR